MIVILLSLLGAGLGYKTASKRGGNKLDKLQFAAVFFLIGAVIGLFATLLIHNLL